MRGTAKQIAWAGNLAEAFRHDAELIRNHPGVNPLNVEFINRVESYLDSLEDAGAIIDNFRHISKAEDAAGALKRIQSLIHFSDGIRAIAEEMKKEAAAAKKEEEAKMVKIETADMVAFEGGEGKRFSGAVNYLHYDHNGVHLYAEIQVPDDTDVSDDYGYFTMQLALSSACMEHGIDPRKLTWQYDSDTAQLSNDCAADGDVFLEVETDDDYYSEVVSC